MIGEFLRSLLNMKRTANNNINTKLYWDGIYTDKNDMKDYDTEDLDYPISDGDSFIYPSKRFTTAVSLIKEGERVLDIGCGPGNFVKRVLDKFPMGEVWGVDISSKVIEDNKVRIPEGVFYQQRIGGLDKVPDNYFDVVFSGEVMEHLEDPSLLFKDAFTSLKDGGRFIMTTPNDTAVNSDEHLWFITKEDVQKFYEDAGFVNIKFIDLPEIEKILILFAVGEKRCLNI